MFGSLSKRFAVPYYQTAEAYRADTGMTPPAFNETKPAKCWFLTPAMAPADDSGFVEFTTVAFKITEAGTPNVKVWPAVGPDGKPFLKRYRLSANDAYTVNIPRKDFSGSVQEQPQIWGELPVPMQPLGPDEELGFHPNMPGLVAILPKVKPAPPGTVTGGVSAAELSALESRLMVQFDTLKTMLEVALASKG